MLLAHKPIDELTVTDLERLLGAQESETVEFVRDMWGMSSGQKRDFLKEVAGMANQRGGELFIGVRETNSTAVELVGVEGEGIVERIESMIASNFDRPLIGVQVHSIPLQTERAVIAIRVPQSLSGPHMITFENLDQFWIRRGRQKGAMTVDEIESSYLRRLDAERFVTQFVTERRQAIRANDHFYHYLSVTPLFFRQQELLEPLQPEILSLLKTPPRHDTYPTWGWLESTTAPNVSGAEASDFFDGDLLFRLEVHRTGHIEMVERNGGASQQSPQDRPVYMNIALDYWRLIEMARRIYNIAALAGPVVVSTAFLGCTGAYLDLAPHRPSNRAVYRLAPGELIFPALYSPNFPTDSGPTFKRLMDRVWNAFRLPSCSYVSDTGELIGQWPR